MLTALISVDTNCRGFYNGGIYAESGGQSPLKLPTIIIPISGPHVFQYTLAISLNYTAAVGMETKLSATAKVTADASYTPFIGCKVQDAKVDFSKSVNNMNLTALKGKVDLNVLQGNAVFGIPHIVTLYEALNAGISAEGTGTNMLLYDLTNLNTDSYHECSYCVDGDVYLHAKMDVGFALNLANLFNHSRNKYPSASDIIEFVGSVDEKGENATMTTVRSTNLVTVNPSTLWISAIVS